MSRLCRCVVVLLVVFVSVVSARADQAPSTPAAAEPRTAAAPAPTAPSDPVSVRIDLTLSRHLGDKRVSSLPFTLLGQVGNRVSLRIGSQVPISTGMTVNYQNVGTNIDATVSSGRVGWFRVDLRLEDSSVAEAPSGAAAGTLNATPVIRSNSLNTVVLVRDGQPTDLVVASDKVSGETIKAEVRVTAIK